MPSIFTLSGSGSGRKKPAKGGRRLDSTLPRPTREQVKQSLGPFATSEQVDRHYAKYGRGAGLDGAKVSPARREFADFLLETLGPDLQDSGRTSTAEDVLQCGQLIKNGRRNVKYARWLKTTLIPDLRASGMTSTAADLARCARYIGPKQKKRS